MARTYTKEAVETLVKWMRNDEEPRASAAAAASILDRGWGKPSQAVEHSGEVKFTPVLEIIIPTKGK